MANLALPAARKYASIAPSSSHAQHMPSHIFTRLGLWDECIQSNLQAEASAKCYAESMGLKGHWDEELHALDYLAYAYLQKGDNQKAKEVCDYVAAMKEVDPPDFKVAYAFAAIPSRYVLENRLWKEAAELQLNNANLQWDDFPWQKAMLYYTRLLGDVHTGQVEAANDQLKRISGIHDQLVAQKDNYKATQVEIQMMTGEAWIEWKKGNNKKAEELMIAAADKEEHTEKHPVTPGELLPARELLGDLYMEMKEPQKALAAYEASLKVHPNRLNGIKGRDRAKAQID
jgi:tetratricopeptide (TPR) repeat protein